MTLSFLQKVGLSFFGGGLELFENGQKISLYYRAFHVVNELYDFTGMLDLSGNFCYDDFFRKSHAQLY